MFQTALCKRLSIEFPIVQAGMAGGPTTPDLVAAVSNHGGLGTIGAGYMTVEALEVAIKRIRQLTDRPFAVNLFCTDWACDYSRLEEVKPVLDQIRANLGLGNLEEVPAGRDMFRDKFDLLLKERVPVFSSAFGLLAKHDVERLTEFGILWTAMVTTVGEAQEAEQQGADVIVAQGSDAGGHRGTFSVDEKKDGANIGTFSLVPQIVDHVQVPVVAAGGVVDGRGLVAALALGAAGVQMGTRFLLTKEAGTASYYRKALLTSTEEDTVLTRAFSGRPARGIDNEFINQFETSGVEPLPFPAQNHLTSTIRKEAGRQQKQEYSSLWSGQGLRLLQRDGEEAGAVVAQLMNEAKSIWRGWNKTAQDPL